MKAVPLGRPDAARLKFFRHILPKLATFFLLLAFLYGSGLCFSVQAEGTESAAPQPPQPGPDFYYLDQANVLSDATRSAILEKNGQLYQAYGVQLVVLTVDALPSGSYSQRVAYLRQVMSSWQIGGSDGRGLLLALAIGDDDYLVAAGDRLKPHFTTDTLKGLLDAQLEPDFQAKAYDSGAAKFFAEAAAQAETYCAAHPELFSESPSKSPAPAGPNLGKKKNTGNQVLLWVGVSAGAVAVVCIAVFLLAGRSGRSRRNTRHTVHRRTSLITPSRTNVLRHESRPTVLIKSSQRSSAGGYKSQKTTRSRSDWRQ